jgi:pyruvate dehydrogenase E2 component (dihydrolipoyllysine-residue acetyltransferase)
MPTNVVMPQMGESIAEGTIVRWIKKIGDSVDRDEPLFEISTDKVDAEIPSPAAGVLMDIKANEGDTVPVNSVVAVIGGAGESAPVEASPPAASSSERMPEAAVGQRETPPAPTPATASPSATPTKEDLRRQKSSPLVRRIARDHHVDIQQIHGTGISGRVTKRDILGFLESGAGAAPAAGETARPLPPPGPAYRPGESVRIVPMSVMRRKIAEHMVLSQRTSAHVYSVFEVNYSRVDDIRKLRKADYEERGVKLTFTAFIAKVAIEALGRHPVINASIDGDNVVYRRDVNLGIAVALDNGLIVPVVKRADELNLLGLSRAIADVADRARAKRLNPDEVHGGTFTITNPGNFGAQFGLPIINQPQVAILGVGTIEKRPVVIDDMIGIRLMGFLTLGYDHRLVDGAVADQFMADLKKGIEGFDPSQV